MTIWETFVFYFVETVKVITMFVAVGIPVIITYILLRALLWWLIDQDWFW